MPLEEEEDDDDDDDDHDNNNDNDNNNTNSLFRVMFTCVFAPYQWPLACKPQRAVDW
jgi:hypothetical protein